MSNTDKPIEKHYRKQAEDMVDAFYKNRILADDLTLTQIHYIKEYIGYMFQANANAVLVGEQLKRDIEKITRRPKKMSKAISSYPKVYSLGHKAIVELLSGPVIVQEKIDGCVSPDSLILCSDLVWRKAKTLEVGDKLIGFKKSENNYFKLCESEVIHNIPIKKNCYRIKTEKSEVVASFNHPFLMRTETAHNPTRFVKAEDLKVGYQIVSIPVWKTDKSWEAGYLAGQFDADGTCFRSKKQRALVYYQRVSNSQKYMKELINNKGFKIRESFRKRNPKWKEMWQCIIKGGWPEILRFLGTIRPKRLFENQKDIWIGGATNGCFKDRIKKIDYIGKHIVQGLETSSKTYIANGLFSHNSQISFGKDMNGTLHARSKGQTLYFDEPEKMFEKGLSAIIEAEASHGLPPGYIFRGEYLQKCKHNVLCYDRIPENHIIIFDIEDASHNSIEDPDVVKQMAQAIGFETVRRFYIGIRNIDGAIMDIVDDLLLRESSLGGTKIEGVVFKNYNRFTPDGKFLAGKFVSEAFKERHNKDWKKSNPGRKDIIQQLIMELKTEARYRKAIQHLKENGEFTGSPEDIGKFLKELHTDIIDEETEYTMEKLFTFFIPQIKRGVCRGAAEYYKRYLIDPDQAWKTFETTQ